VQEIANWLNWLLIALTALAAFFWLLAATATVKPEDPDDTGDFRIVVYDDPGKGSFTSNGIDVLATAQVQTKWNRWAASFACAAAVCQAVIRFLPKLS
jgi:hypothetical protein